MVNLKATTPTASSLSLPDFANCLLSLAGHISKISSKSKQRKLKTSFLTLLVCFFILLQNLFSASFPVSSVHTFSLCPYPPASSASKHKRVLVTHHKLNPAKPSLLSVPSSFAKFLERAEQPFFTLLFSLQIRKTSLLLSRL